MLEFLEKTGRARSPGEINAGMYVLERSVLDLIPPGEEVSIERDVFPRLVGDGLHGLRLDGYWMDIGTPERYLQASWDILERRVETRVEPTAPGMLVASGADVAAGATVGPRACSVPAVASGTALRSATRCCSTAACIGEGAGSAARSSRPASRSPPARTLGRRRGRSGERVPAEGRVPA